MRYLVAVSGGVDSVVLLDMLARSGRHELLVAHMDHGIRPDSAADSRFVEALAKKYGLPFFLHQEALGENASEETARRQRYVFLRRLAKEKGAVIATAHHRDDAIETIAINLTRGTGWRGLAVFGAQDIARLLVGLSKNEIYEYAMKHRLEWVEDETNQTSRYLRNRIRSRLARMLTPLAKEKLVELWAKQTSLKARIRREVEGLMSDTSRFSRYFFICMPEDVALELLRQAVVRRTGKVLQLPQLERGLLAIKTVRPHATIQLGDGVELVFSRDGFIAQCK